MSVSMGPFIICFLCIVFLTVYLHVVLYRPGCRPVCSAKAVSAGIIVILLRMCIPVNFPFTYTVYSHRFLRPFAEIVYADLGGSGYKPYDLLLFCWLTVAVIRLIRLCVKVSNLRRYLEAYAVTDKSLHPRLSAFVRKYCPERIRIAVIPQDISPAISGLFHPTLIFPECYGCFSDEELEYICMHEANHYRNHDLWIGCILEILVCIHWWNPLVCLLKKEYTLALELANDRLLMENGMERDRVHYAELILKIAEWKGTAAFESSKGLINFVRRDHSDLGVRLSFALNKTEKKKYSWLHIVVICSVMLFSLFIVPEADSREGPIGEDGTFEMHPENTYFIHTLNGYEIYVDGQHVATINEIPEDFKNYKMYEEGEFVNE